MTEQRHGYWTDRVLLDAARLLSPQFDGFWIHIDGAQVEMLRNVVAYLNRPSSYVDTYADDYYITPDTTDFDALQAIVADLEHKLMGNDNTPWGYNDRVAYQEIVTGSAPGTVDVKTSPVDEHKIQRITEITVFNNTSVNTTITLQVVQGTITHYLRLWQLPAAYIPQTWSGDLTLKEDDHILAMFYGCTSGDDLYLQVTGYEMVVP